MYNYYFKMSFASGSGGSAAEGLLVDIADILVVRKFLRF
jgi:hypothetical protein